MPVRINTALYQSNVEKALIAITHEDTGLPQDLTGATIEVYIKPTPETDDADPSVVKLTNSPPNGVIVTSVSNGTATITFPPSLDAGTLWWRTDVVISGVRKTACYGSLYVTDI